MNKSGTATQIISPPKGGGALSGIGEKFSPDLFTGTGNFSVPISLPPGRNGFQPDLSLQYSTGNGNSPFGLGWGISVPGIHRKTSKGIPVYDDAKDVFILSGVEDLVPVEKNSEWVRYQPRTEGLFAKIYHIHTSEENYWKVMTKDGLVSYYGKLSGDAGATIFKPDNSEKIFSWHLTRTEDAFGNCIEYAYEQDLAKTNDRSFNQLYIKEIRYLNYDEGDDQKFLVSIKFNFQDRADAFSSFRQGFEIRTRKRCDSIEVFSHHNTENLIRRYKLFYLDQLVEQGDVPVKNLPINGVSLLSRIEVTGHKEGKKESLPPLTFDYSRFIPEKTDLTHLEGKDLPPLNLAHPGYDLVDLFGNGLPDIIEMNGGYARYWRNLGKGKFDLPRRMQDIPAGLFLGSPDVQFIDANGDARADLMVNSPALSGYFATEFGGTWSRESFQKYDQAPSFRLQGPEVKLLDLNGDGITDVLRSGERLELFYHDPEKGWSGSQQVVRKQLDDFPNINFSDPRIRVADMSGDGMQDIVMIHPGRIEYWANMGYGKFSNRLSMAHSPRLPYRFNPERLLLGDVDGDGLADLIYVENNKIILWINQSGNSWSDPIEISGTPGVTDMDAVRLEDMLGTGVAGVLWSKIAGSNQRHHLHFLDLTGGYKPYLLHEVNNHMGAITRVHYRSSIEYYIQDEKRSETRWKTTLPFPVQTVAKVEVIDELSKGKLTTTYQYHHGYWDGGEREFRGFGRVDQQDSEVFEQYQAQGLHGDTDFQQVEELYFSPPVLVKNWFHLGAVGRKEGEWGEVDFSNEFWQEDPSVWNEAEGMNTLLPVLSRRARRDAFRALRGNTLRTELYALDGTPRQNRPYTVSESQLGIQLKHTPTENLYSEKHIFFAFIAATRNTQWERGNDPMTQLSFTSDFDEYGQPQSQINIAVPRGRDFRNFHPNPEEPYLATFSATTFCLPKDSFDFFRTDRVARTTNYEVLNNGKTDALTLTRNILQGDAEYKVIGQSFTFYDGEAFEGLPFRETGDYGLPVKSETLILTPQILVEAYGDDMPPYLDSDGPLTWPDEYPGSIQESMPSLAGYQYHDGSEYTTGYYAVGGRTQYDFQAGVLNPKGLPLVSRDPFDNESTIEYDDYQFLPVQVTDARNLSMQATYDYTTMQVKQMTDPNGNRSAFAFSPLGLLQKTVVMGKEDQDVGDTFSHPGTRYEYDFFAFANNQQPVWVKTIVRENHVQDNINDNTLQTVEYSDGFGRLLQSRTQTDEVVFGDNWFGDSGLPIDVSAQNEPAVGQPAAAGQPNVVVSGWKVYNNKGWVVEQYEPYFDQGWEFDPPVEGAYGKRIRQYYDPRGNVIRTINPDGTQQRVIYGVIEANALDRPDIYSPTPWETFTYDANDLAPITHPSDSSVPTSHHYTPNSNLLDALGRTIRTTNHLAQLNENGDAEDVVMQYHYDIRGNLVQVTDPYGRTAFIHAYDLKPKTGENDPGANILRTVHLDGGVKTVVYDGAGNSLEMRDSKGALILHTYDNLLRPHQVWARDKDDAPVTLRQLSLYGDEDFAPVNATELNLPGKLYQQFDEAGLVTINSYDFKGNPLQKARQVIADEPIISGMQNSSAPQYTVDWSAGDLSMLQSVLLDSRTYATEMEYDALNRITKLTCPEDVEGGKNILFPAYNRAGAVQKLSLLRENGQTEECIRHIAYSAKGQRLLIAYGNGMMTRYAYHSSNFRLLRMKTEAFQQDDWMFIPQSGSTRQDFSYSYDLNGNIRSIHDHTPNSGIPSNPDELRRNFDYDPLNRLLKATGREQNSLPVSPPWMDTPLVSDPNLTRKYTRNYTYDKLGNIQQLSHITPNGAGSFTRSFDYQTGKNKLEKVTVGDNEYDFAYDENGNQIQENASRFFHWDYADRLRGFHVQSGNVPSQQAQYLYDNGGNRVKKLVRKQGGKIEVTIYIDGLIDHQYTIQGAQTIENNSLHIMDNRSRVASLRIGVPFDDDSTPAWKYNLEDHLGNSSATLTQTGSWISREDYFPFGKTSFGRYAKKRYRFVGKEKDEESGLYYYGARYYAPWNCRFVSIDPLFRDYPFYTPYQYAGNKPVNFIDLDGLEESEANSKNLATKEPNINSSNDNVTNYTTKPPIIEVDNLKTTINIINNTQNIQSEKNRSSPELDLTKAGKFTFKGLEYSNSYSVKYLNSKYYSIGNNGKIYINKFQGNQYVKVTKFSDAAKDLKNFKNVKYGMKIVPKVFDAIIIAKDAYDVYNSLDENKSEIERRTATLIVDTAGIILGYYVPGYGLFMTMMAIAPYHPDYSRNQYLGAKIQLDDIREKYEDDIITYEWLKKYDPEVKYLYGIVINYERAHSTYDPNSQPVIKQGY
jgi:RHS repeat-associated protein